MNKITRYIFSIISIVILVIVFAPVFAFLNERIFGSSVSIFTFVLDPIMNIFIGLLLSYTFFIPLTFTVFFGKPEKYYAILVFIGFELFFMLSDISVLMIVIPLALVGWLIGEGIVRLYKVIKK
ncbi:MAG: hypothetical protein WC517_01045 [Patescibacteria group bacterium]